MEATSQQLVCKYCQQAGTGKYCNQCGQLFVAKRITFSSIRHEVFHFFTHMDKGILFTLKKLITSPGAMQRDYIHGDRFKRQKPFSTFFIGATFLRSHLTG
jgi:hypothetical protein